uniref:MAM domain-containing protein n=1 Tax=Timema cristinae TaxID=61476 RepID=A0A7R9H749_TIMCR|nr:unnamed protein product [Timema cristinae]
MMADNHISRSFTAMSIEDPCFKETHQAWGNIAMPPGAIVRNGECRFERDTCEWLNDTQDRNSPSWRLATVSRRPANLPDKTFGAPEGYIYFDLFNQNSGSNTARLISPTVTASSDEQQLCFNFWFAAFGAGDSVELRVMRQDNSSNVEDPIEKLWVLDAKDMDTTRPKMDTSPSDCRC